MKKWIDFGWAERKKEIEMVKLNNQRLERENDNLRKDLFRAFNEIERLRSKYEPYERTVSILS